MPGKSPSDEPKPEEEDRPTIAWRPPPEASEFASALFSETEIHQSDGTNQSDAANQTDLAPSFPAPLPGSTPKTISAPDELEVGDRIDDYRILAVLGTGAFGVVYLAQQVSLARQVALKITRDLGNEGRTLAQLEHKNIVQVFAERKLGRLRLLCMQHIAGAPLDHIISMLHKQHGTDWNGDLFLKTIDQLNRYPARLDPTALEDREILQNADRIEVVAWLGARLAHALGFAHQDGTYHRDIKPGNILVNQYGRPYLLDFNLSFQSLEDQGSQVFGGTIAYMAPEHLDAFNPHHGAEPDVVNEQSDIYSLGLVLYELATGELPFPIDQQHRSTDRFLSDEADRRRGETPMIQQPDSVVLAQTLARSLQPDPQARYASANEMGEALDGVRFHRRAVRAMPSASRLMIAIGKRPFLWLAILSVAPHMAGSIINIAYNMTRIVPSLQEEGQKWMFMMVMAGYNVIAYPLCLTLALLAVLPIYRVLSAGVQHCSPEQVTQARRRSLQLPAVAAGLAALGWFPGGVLFPWLIGIWTVPVPSHHFIHFVFSFTISGLVALTYSTLAIQCQSVCVFYPRLWATAPKFATAARQDLQPVENRLWMYQVLAGLIPLSAAILMIIVAPAEFVEETFAPRSYRMFRGLLTGLIALGMLGFQLAMFVTGTLNRSLAVLTKWG